MTFNTEIHYLTSKDGHLYAIVFMPTQLQREELYGKGFYFFRILSNGEEMWVASENPTVLEGGE